MGRFVFSNNATRYVALNIASNPNMLEEAKDILASGGKARELSRALSRKSYLPTELRTSAGRKRVVTRWEEVEQYLRGLTN